MSQFVTLDAAAQFVGPGALWLEEYQPVINDILRRSTYLNQRIRKVPATGQPSRYFEQTGLPGAPSFADPQSLSYSAQVAPVRSEASVYLKALVDSLNFGLFNVEVTKQQGRFGQLEGQDLEDLIGSLMLSHDNALINGTATSLTAAPTSQVQYVGLTNQLKAGSNVAAGANVVDAIKTQVAQLCANTKFNIMPTAIYLHPLTINKIEQQEKSNQRYFNTVEILPGVQVQAIPTVAGNLPLIPNPLMPQAQISAANDSYELYIVTESMIEYHYLTTDAPRVFQLGTVNDLASKYVVVKFGALIAKSAADPASASDPLAHCKMKVAKA